MAVFNGSVNDIESKKNKVSSISENPSDEKYPSEKAVKDYVDNNSGGGGGTTEEVVDGKIASALEEWGRQNQPETQLYKANDITEIDDVDGEYMYPNVNAVKNYVEEEFTDAGANYGLEKQDNKVEAMGDASDKNVAYPTVGAVEAYVEEQIGDIETALDSIIAIQESLIGTITFTIDDVSYTAPKGMTWAEWCDSEYNTGGFIRDDSMYESEGVILIVDPSNGLYVSEIIIEDGEEAAYAVYGDAEINDGYNYTAQ